MRKEESKFTDKVKADIKKIEGVWFYKTSEIARRGIPDIIGCIRGKFFALEIKTELGKLDLLQDHTLILIKASGGFGAVVRPSNWSGVRAALLAFSAH